MALLLTFITGVFFLIGIISTYFVKDNKKFSVFAIALAFVVLLNVIVFDILPEVLEAISFRKFLFIVLGFFILKLMDLFVPHHDHEHHAENDDEKEHHHHLEHISIITILALSLHNVIECMALFNVTTTSVKAGIMMCLAIGMHNLPLGCQIGCSLKNNNFLYISFLVLSGFMGGLISLGIGGIPEIYTTYILCFTLGMLLYLTFLELFKELIVQIKNKYTIYGIIIGMIFIVITNVM